MKSLRISAIVGNEQKTRRKQDYRNASKQEPIEQMTEEE
jgi:hypothetical protein